MIKLNLQEMPDKQVRKIAVEGSMDAADNNSIVKTLEAEIKEKGPEGKMILSFNEPDFEKVLARIGKMPLPPYIKRLSKEEDKDRYQTIYAQKNSELHLINGSYPNTKFYVYGGTNESGNAAYFDQSYNLNLVNLISKNTLRETVYYISQMDIFISNDTGLMHITASQGVPLIALFCNTDVVKNRPFVEDDAKLAIISKDLPCKPCYSWYRNINCNDRRCVDLISVAETFNAVSSFINRYYKNRISKGE